MVVGRRVLWLGESQVPGGVVELLQSAPVVVVVRLGQGESVCVVFCLSAAAAATSSEGHLAAAAAATRERRRQRGVEDIGHGVFAGASPALR